jgi:hypothetical protein
MKLAPIGLWAGNEGARRDWNEYINSPAARAAISFALADYQREVAHLPDGASMLKGCNGIIERLMNMGELKTARKTLDFQLPNPDEFNPIIKS